VFNPKKESAPASRFTRGFVTGVVTAAGAAAGVTDVVTAAAAETGPVV
jgi:hypothetical protein